MADMSLAAFAEELARAATHRLDDGEGTVLHLPVETARLLPELCAERGLTFDPVNRYGAYVNTVDASERPLEIIVAAPSLDVCVAIANAYDMVEKVIVTLEHGPISFDRLLKVFAATLPGGPEQELATRVETAVRELALHELYDGSFSTRVRAHSPTAEVLAVLLNDAAIGAGSTIADQLHLFGASTLPLLEIAGLHEVARVLNA